MSNTPLFTTLQPNHIAQSLQVSQFPCFNTTTLSEPAYAPYLSPPDLTRLHARTKRHCSCITCQAPGLPLPTLAVPPAFPWYISLVHTAELRPRGSGGVSLTISRPQVILVTLHCSRNLEEFSTSTPLPSTLHNLNCWDQVFYIHSTEEPLHSRNIYTR